ncbi:hypothetical protein SAMN04488012_107125 [Palleronia salina]|uniref:Hemolysin-type calcium-binding repeat-containing protein n=2 Tax=Palleronia salina TaxID=313368 RepID=A0A1M6ICS8_9RHOB|nr:hypothetical protein SAMN04488012_107125 [Palleronia salina]
MGLVFLEDRHQAPVPPAQRLLLRIRNIAQFRHHVRAFGVVVSEQDANQIERTNDAISRLGLIWRGLSNQFAVAAAPALEAVANAMAAVASRTGPLGIAIRGLFENIGRLTTYAATFAALLAGRWVAGMAAAALSLRGLATALVVLRGAHVDDDLRGLGDYDWFIATEGQDTLDGGNGLDMLSFVEWGGSGTDALLDVFSTDGAPPAGAVANGITLDLAAPSAGTGLAAGLTLTSIERVTGSSYQDVFHGDGGENDFRGLGGYDWFVSSTGGRERYFGGRGSDTVTYFNASSGIAANLSNGAMVDGEETGFGSAGDARLDLYFGIENLVGTAFDDSLSGSNERNQLNGLEGDDIIFGHGGVDYLKGGDGNDTIDGGDGSDFALFDGEMADYTLSRHAANEVTVDHAGGTDHLIDVEYLRFDDQQISLWSLPIG